MQIPYKIKKVWDAVTTSFVVLVVLLAIVLVGVRLFGLQVFTVLSGSMEPQYPVGSLIYVKEVDYKTLKPGDVVTCRLNDKTISTHRIVEIVVDKEDPQIYLFYTKGDANEEADRVPIPCTDIIGTPVCTIPYLGYVAHYIQRPPGMYVAIAAGAALLLLVFLPDLLFPKDKKSDPTPENAPEKESI